jgi:hypothetical protein
MEPSIDQPNPIALSAVPPTDPLSVTDPEAQVTVRRLGGRGCAPGQATLQTNRIHLIPLSDQHLEHEVELDARSEN